jgi:dolichol-phosphate mannosyltransferase
MPSRVRSPHLVKNPTSKNKSTWIVIPTFNEKENIPKLINGLFGLAIDNLHLLFVDDASPDGTGEVIETLGKSYPGKVNCLHRSGKLGLGSAYIAGFQHALNAGAVVIIQMDADFSHPIDKIPLMLKSLNDCDILIGSRYVNGGSLDDRWSPFRKWLSGFGNWYARTILRLPIRDVTGGFKFWKAETLAALPLERVKSNGYVFQVEMNYLAWKLGYKFMELPIHFADRQWGKSKMSFRIQMEAALRVWFLPSRYADIKQSFR